MRLIATDLDGTLFGPDLRISPRTREVLESASERGIKLCLATGRMVRATMPFVAQLPVRAPLITYQGALIADPATGEWLWHRPVPRPLADEVVALSREFGLHVNLYLGDRLLLEAITPEAEFYMGLSRVEPEVVRFGDVTGDPTKVTAIGDADRVQLAYEALAPRFEGRLNVATSLPQLLEFTHPEADKGKALAEVCRRLDIPRDEVVAFGDGLNDLSMLEYAGLGVAMGNGAPALKAKAGAIAGPLAEDGLARFLEDLLGLVPAR